MSLCRRREMFCDQEIYIWCCLHVLLLTLYITNMFTYLAYWPAESVGRNFWRHPYLDSVTLRNNNFYLELFNGIGAFICKLWEIEWYSVCEQYSKSVSAEGWRGFVIKILIWICLSLLNTPPLSSLSKIMPRIICIQSISRPVALHLTLSLNIS